MMINHIQADIIRVEPTEEYPTGFFSTCFVGGKQKLFNEKPSLKTEIPDFSQYDTVLVGSPIWAWGLSVPMKTFLGQSDLSGKKIAVFSTSSGPQGSGPYKDVVKLLPNAEVLPDYLNIQSNKVDTSEEAVIQWLQNIGLLEQQKNETKEDEL